MVRKRRIEKGFTDKEKNVGKQLVKIGEFTESLSRAWIFLVFVFCSLGGFIFGLVSIFYISVKESWNLNSLIVITGVFQTIILTGVAIILARLIILIVLGAIVERRNKR